MTTGAPAGALHWHESRARPRPPDLGFLGPEAAAEARRFHRGLEGYEPTPLISLTGRAERLGLAAVELKDESGRFGLGAFKALGATFALDRMATGGEARTFVTATDGNHGRAVAWAASRLGHSSVVYLPAAASGARERAIAELGAETRRVAGSYDDAVAAAEAEAGRRGWLLLQDTGWPGYDEVPRLVMQGYLTLMSEVLEQLDGVAPTHVLLQCGVGSFAAAMAGHLAARLREGRPRVVVVEPAGAACGLAAARAGGEEPPRLGHDPHTFMACLSCGRLSHTAWPLLRSLVDFWVAAPDEVARRGMRSLAGPSGQEAVTGGAGQDPEVVAGESGAVTLGLLERLCGPGAGPGERALRDRLGLGPDARVLLFATEGATDPGIWRRVVGREPDPTAPGGEIG